MKNRNLSISNSSDDHDLEKLKEAIRKTSFISAKAVWLPKPQNLIAIWPVDEILRLCEEDPGGTFDGLVIHVENPEHLDALIHLVRKLKGPEPKTAICHLVERTLKAGQVKLGPIIHRQLSAELEERIRKFEPVLAEVYPKSHQEWLEGFQRDLIPEDEVKIFEAIASAYQSFLAKQALMLPAKEEAFGLLCAAVGTLKEALARCKLRFLTRQQATELLGLYLGALRAGQRPFLSN
jgi:hypothetical protein